MTIRRLAAGAAILLLLSGCARLATDAAVAPGSAGEGTPLSSGTASVAPVPATSATASAIASAAPTPTATPVLGIDDLDATSEGLGVLRIGQPVPHTEAAAALVTWDPDICEFEGHEQNPVGMWLPARKPGGQYPFTLFTEDWGRDDPIDLMYFGDQVRTPHGLGVGSTAKEIRALGGVKQNGDAPDYYDTYVIHGTAGELVFHLAASDGASVRTVESFQIQREGTDPVMIWEGPCE